MVVIFGGLLAARLPLLGAIAAVAGAFLCLLGFAAVITLDPNTVPVTTLLGLGLSIDYALLMVSRFREERAGGRGRARRGRADRGHRRAHDRVLRADRRGLAVRPVRSSTTRSSGPSARPGSPWSWSRCWPRSPWCRRCSALVGGRIPVRRALAPDRGLLRPAGPARCSGGPGWSRSASPRLLLAAGAPLLLAEAGRTAGPTCCRDSFESVQLQQNLQVRFPGAGTDPVTVRGSGDTGAARRVRRRAAAGGRTPRRVSVPAEPAGQLAVRVGGHHPDRLVPGRRGAAAGQRAARAPARRSRAG